MFVFWGKETVHHVTTSIGVVPRFGHYEHFMDPVLCLQQVVIKVKCIRLIDRCWFVLLLVLPPPPLRYCTFVQNGSGATFLPSAGCLKSALIFLTVPSSVHSSSSSSSSSHWPLRRPFDWCKLKTVLLIECVCVLQPRMFGCSVAFTSKIKVTSLVPFLPPPLTNPFSGSGLQHGCRLPTSCPYFPVSRTAGPTLSMF